MRSYRIYLYRHGITQANLEGRYVGSTDVSLCEEGRKELRKLAEEKEYPAIGKLYASPLKRCLETAEILYPEMAVTTVDKIREYDFGIYENKTIAELKNVPGFLEWMESKMAKTPEQGENMEDFSERIREGFDEIIKDMMKNKISAAGVVTHGGVIMGIMGMCGLPRMAATNWITKNGEGYAILVNASLWGNTMSFEICERIPYGIDDEFDTKVYEMLDVDKLREDYRNEQG